jgi:hypothetical protein
MKPQASKPTNPLIYWSIHYIGGHYILWDPAFKTNTEDPPLVSLNTFFLIEFQNLSIDEHRNSSLIEK